MRDGVWRKDGCVPNKVGSKELPHEFLTAKSISFGVRVLLLVPLASYMIYIFPTQNQLLTSKCLKTKTKTKKQDQA